jgi:hypothetical protein
MLRRGIGSALFVDYENVGRSVLANSVPNWLAWLEEGEFDENKRRRRIIEKRVYLNPALEKHKPVFEQCGFSVIVCDKFTALKNSADIRIALDMFELASTNRNIQEFILFSSDSDFIPVIQKLALRNKEAAVIVDQTKEGIYSAYRYQADTLIPLADLLGAVTYERPQRNFFGFKIKKAQAVQSASGSQASRAEPQPAQGTPREGPAKKSAAAKPALPQTPIDLAAARIVRLAAQRPKLFIGQKTVETHLKSISGFSKTGEDAYFGKSSYQELMKEVERLTGQISVTPAKGTGIQVKYKPKQE